jgi:sialic acid synthase SpsE
LSPTWPHQRSGSSGPYFIAEIGVNHEGSTDRARRLIEAAASAGADCVKFQTYKAERLALVDSPAYWDQEAEPTPTQFELFKKFDSFKYADYADLAEECRLNGIDFASTPFDTFSVEALTPLVKFFKIASADITNVPLLRKVADSDKDVIMSTGACTEPEIEQALKYLALSSDKVTTLLHCVLSYPTQAADANLGLISRLRERFPNCVIGYSDHTLRTSKGESVSAAIALGAAVIETHFTDDIHGAGNDHYHAVDEDGLRDLIKTARNVSELVGSFGATTPREILPSEESSRREARRCVVSSNELDCGAIISSADITTLRPASCGIPAESWDDIIGRRTLRSIPAGTPLNWTDLE